MTVNDCAGDHCPSPMRCASSGSCAAVPVEKRSADRCAKCGYERKEHGYNGACYGVCGEFVFPSQPESGEIAKIVSIWSDASLGTKNAIREEHFMLAECLDKLVKQPAGQPVLMSRSEARSLAAAIIEAPLVRKS